MNRRGFFQSIGAAAGAVALPTAPTPFPWRGEGNYTTLCSTGRVSCKTANTQNLPRAEYVAMCPKHMRRRYSINEMNT